MRIRYESLSLELIEEIKAIGESRELSRLQISEKYNITQYTFNKVMHDGRVVVGTGGIQKRKYNCDDSFFDIINTEEKAYWLGFIYADGCITCGNHLQVSLAAKDAKHLEKFRDALKSTNPVHVYKGTCTGVEIAYCKLDIRSSQLYNQLNVKGVTERKTNTLTFPEDGIVPKELVSHFLRGYFDGDGTINIQRQYKTPQCRIQIMGTEDMLLGFIKQLPIHPKILKDKTFFTRKEGQTVKCFQYGGNQCCRAIFDFLYQGATIYLDRKHEIYLQHFYS